MTDKTTDKIRFVLNGEDIELGGFSPRLTLLDWLRLDRRLTGTKEGCAEGDCGACTVLVGRLIDGRLAYESVNACIRFMGSLHATHVVTVEHLKGKDGRLHPVQQALVDTHGSQCGFCTPGFVMSLYGLWLSNDNPSRGEIETALQGNLCRCTGYEPIVKAAELVARKRPNALFDPIEATRRDISERLMRIADGGTIEISHHGDTLYVPGSAGALAELLAAHPNATLVAGSTDVGLWVTKQMRPINPVIFINGISALQAIKADDRGVTLGAGVTYAQALATLERTHPQLARLIHRIGGAQVRNMGTIGGNIANGSPIGDMPPALIALGAEITLRSREGDRRLLLESFFIDYGKQDRERHEFVEAIHVPVVPDGVEFAVHKLTKRRDEDITAVLGAFWLKRDHDGRVADIRLAFGGMAGIPKRATNMENALLGRPWTEASVRAAIARLPEDFTPLSDWRATAEYRSLTAGNLLVRFFLESQGGEAQLVRFGAGER